MKSKEYAELRLRGIVRLEDPRVFAAISTLSDVIELGDLGVDYWDIDEDDLPEPELFFDDNGVLRAKEWFDAQEAQA